MIKKRLFYFTGILVLAVSHSGCYGDIHITTTFPENGRYSHDSSLVVFFHIAKAARPAKGITAFPDGGTSKTLFKNVSLYQYNIKDGKIKTIFNFGNLPYYHSRWNHSLFLKNDSVIFNIVPISGWQQELEWGFDSSLFQKLNKWFVYRLASGEIILTDSIKQIYSPGRVISISELETLTKDNTYKEWGIDLDSIYPSHIIKRTKELAELHGNQEYRDALIEQIGPELDNDDIRKIINNINKYFGNLDNYNKLVRRESYEATILKLQTLMN